MLDFFKRAVRSFNRRCERNYLKNKEAMDPQIWIWKRCTEQAVVVGQGIEYAYLVTGHYIFPAIVRHHYSNLFDVPFGAAMFNNAQMLITGGKSRPILSDAISLSVFTAEKYLMCSLRRVAFDWGDETCFLIGTAAYVAASGIARHRATKRAARMQAVSVPQQ